MFDITSNITQSIVKILNQSHVQQYLNQYNLLQYYDTILDFVPLCVNVKILHDKIKYYSHNQDIQNIYEFYLQCINELKNIPNPFYCEFPKQDQYLLSEFFVYTFTVLVYNHIFDQEYNLLYEYFIQRYIYADDSNDFNDMINSLCERCKYEHIKFILYQVKPKICVLERPTFETCAQFGSVECLQLLHSYESIIEDNVPQNMYQYLLGSIVTESVRFNRFDCLEFVQTLLNNQHKYIFNLYHLYICSKNNHHDMFSYIISSKNLDTNVNEYRFKFEDLVTYCITQERWNHVLVILSFHPNMNECATILHKLHYTTQDLDGLHPYLDLLSKSNILQNFSSLHQQYQEFLEINKERKKVLQQSNVLYDDCISVVCLFL